MTGVQTCALPISNFFIILPPLLIFFVNIPSFPFSVNTVIFILIIVGYTIYQSQSNSDSDVIKIGFLVPTLENPFFVDMTESAKSLDSDDLKVLVQANQDELRQNQIIENFIVQGVDAICVVPINSESVIPAVIKANKAGIPVINVDNKINMESAKQQGAKIAFYIGSDNFEGGQLAGKFLAEKLKGIGKVAILEGVAGNDAAIKRKGGFKEAINDFPKIEVVASQAADWNRQKANDIFQAILTANPDLNAVFACNDEMALGALKAIKNTKQKIKIIGFDGIGKVLNLIKEGKIEATIVQSTYEIGKYSIEKAVDYLNGKKLKSKILTTLKLKTI